jgi:hypothetical protein
MSKGKALRLLNEMIDTLPEGMDIVLEQRFIYYISTHRT